MKIENLKVEDLRSPVGVDFRAHRFSFETDVCEGLFTVSLYAGTSEVAEQECVVMKSECESFRFSADLQAGTFYRWEVSNGHMHVGAHFETAERFDAPFVKAPQESDSLPVFSRAVDIPAEVVHAYLYVASSCVHALFLNQERVGGVRRDLEGSLFCVYDISPYLWRGSENMLRICLSRRASAAASLVLYFRDGHRKAIRTDESWTVSESGVFWDALRCSERHIVPNRAHGVMRAVQSEAQRPSGMRALGMRAERRKTLRPIAVQATETGFLLDYGRRIEGFVRLHAKLAAGQCVYLHMEETPTQAHMNGSSFSVCGDGETCRFEPLFLRCSFRYVRVVGLSEAEVQDMEAVSLSDPDE